MKLVGKNGLSGVLEIAMWVLMALSVLMLVCVHWIVTWMMELNVHNELWDPAFWYPRYIITLGVSGVMALLMLWQARKILRNANRGTIFSMDTVHRMKVLGVQAFTVSAFYAVMLLCGMTKFSVGLIALVFLLAGLMAWLFSEFFKQATEYKQENDMTI